MIELHTSTLHISLFVFAQAESTAQVSKWNFKLFVTLVAQLYFSK